MPSLPSWSAGSIRSIGCDPTVPPVVPCAIPSRAGIIGAMHRPTLAVIAILLLAFGVYTRQQPENETLSAACLRIGVVMGILWFAQPQTKNIPRWAIALGGAGLLMVMRWPKLLLFALPIAALLWALRPRTPGSRMGRNRPS